MAYSGSGDPHDHGVAFQTQMFISCGDDAVSCKMFAKTMKDVALCWYDLPPSSIANNDDLTSRFTIPSSRPTRLYCPTSTRGKASHSRVSCLVSTA